MPKNKGGKCTTENHSNWNTDCACNILFETFKPDKQQTHDKKPRKEDINMYRFGGFLLIFISLICGLIALASLFATLYAFTAQDTTAAVESLFGTSVVTLMFSILAHKSFLAGRNRLISEQKSQSAQAE